MAIIPMVVEQHAEEAAFLWLLRDSAVMEPHYSLSDLAHLDDRTEAHVDGLRIAGDEGWEICKEAFAWEEAGEIFIAAVLAFESGNKDRIKKVIEAGLAEPELTRGIVSALGWLSYQQAEKLNTSFLRSKSPMLRSIGIASSAVHRKDPRKILHEGLTSSDPSLKARTLKAIGELGKTNFAAAVKDHLNDEDENCRYFAAWSSSLLGNMTGLPVLQNIAETEGRHAEGACSIALRRMSVAEGLDWNRAVAKKADLQRIALISAGAIGDPALIPWLMEYMSIPEMARVAGESFT
ncbi:MAG: TIGR02270 family protein, partial [Planctomycetota bacterium]